MGKNVYEASTSDHYRSNSTKMNLMYLGLNFVIRKKITINIPLPQVPVRSNHIPIHTNRGNLLRKTSISKLFPILLIIKTEKKIVCS